MNALNVIYFKQLLLQPLESRQLLDATAHTMGDAQQETNNFDVSDYFDYQGRLEQVQAIAEANLKPAVVTGAVELAAHVLTGSVLYKVGSKMGGHGKALAIAGGATTAIPGFDLEAQGAKVVYDYCNSWEQEEVVDAVITGGGRAINYPKWLVSEGFSWIGWGVSTSFNQSWSAGTAFIDFVYQTVGTSAEVAQQADATWSTVTGLTVIDYNVGYAAKWLSNHFGVEAGVQTVFNNGMSGASVVSLAVWMGSVYGLSKVAYNQPQYFAYGALGWAVGGMVGRFYLNGGDVMEALETDSERLKLAGAVLGGYVAEEVRQWGVEAGTGLITYERAREAGLAGVGVGLAGMTNHMNHELSVLDAMPIPAGGLPAGVQVVAKEALDGLLEGAFSAVNVNGIPQSVAMPVLDKVQVVIQEHVNAFVDNAFEAVGAISIPESLEIVVPAGVQVVAKETLDDLLEGAFSAIPVPEGGLPAVLQVVIHEQYVQNLDNLQAGLNEQYAAANQPVSLLGAIFKRIGETPYVGRVLAIQGQVIEFGLKLLRIYGATRTILDVSGVVYDAAYKALSSEALSGAVQEAKAFVGFAADTPKGK